MKKTDYKFPTLDQKNLVAAIDKMDTIRHASSTVDLTPKQAYNKIDALKDRYRKARYFVNWYEAQRRRSRRLAMILDPNRYGPFEKLAPKTQDEITEEQEPITQVPESESVPRIPGVPEEEMEGLT